MAKLRHAMVCGSNMNRSMEAHKVLAEKGFEVESFGVGSHVKIPGPSANQPNVYPFGTPYTDIKADLEGKDPALYTRNGLLKMLTRNITTKRAPERWQDCKEIFDVAVCFDIRVMETLVDDMNKRPQSLLKPLLVVNIDVKDNADEAAIAAPQALSICHMVEEAEDWEDDIDAIITKFEAETGRKAVYTICFY